MEDKKLKILMTTDTVGGVWNYAVDLCHGLRDYSVEIHLATMGGYLSPSQRDQLGSLDNVVVYESDYKLEWMHDPWVEVEKAYHWIKEIHNDIDPDIIHFNNYGQAQYHWKTPTIVVAHSCVLSWWKAVKKEEAPFEWNKYKNIVKKALLNADIVVAPTQYFLNEVENIYGSFIHKKVIHNGRNFAETSFREKEPFILSAGRVWDEAKNLSVLMQLAGHLEWPVYISGENGHPVTKKVVQTENVHYLGHLSPVELQDWMQRAAIYALPAHYEPFGLSALEAAHAGCALLLGDIGTLREVWNDAAVYVDQNNPKMVAAALDKLIYNEHCRLKYAARAKERSTNYNLDKMAQHYYSTYLHLLPKLSQHRKTLIGVKI
jgi:glycosyltransferase involved in cell wall biosynthesis